MTAARLRHTTPKPRFRRSSLDLNSFTNPNKDTTAFTASDSAFSISEFQLKLSRNPYALALATPVRQCCLTGARLPVGCLLSFGLATHPSTGKMWHLPRVAAERDDKGQKGKRGRILLVGKGEGKKRSAAGAEDGQGEEEGGGGRVEHEQAKAGEEMDEEQGKDHGDNAGHEGGVPQKSSTAAADTRFGTANGEGTESTNEAGAEAPHRPLGRERAATAVGGQSRALSSTYYLSSARALRNIGTRKKREYTLMMSHRWKDDQAFDINRIVWREDMDDFVKGLLRRKVMSGLERLTSGKEREKSKSQAAVMVCEEGWESLATMRDVAGVLWFGVGQYDEKVDRDAGSERGSGGGAGGGGGDEKAVDALPTEDTARQVAQMLKTAGGPLPYAMLRFPSPSPNPSRCIPVYNLPKLLGGEHIKQLREGLAGWAYGGSLTVIRSKNTNTTKIQRELWRLMGYLSNEGGWISEDA